MGGLTAYNIASAHSDRPRGLVVVDARPGKSAQTMRNNASNHSSPKTAELDSLGRRGVTAGPAFNPRRDHRMLR